MKGFWVSVLLLLVLSHGNADFYGSNEPVAPPEEPGEYQSPPDFNPIVSRNRKINSHLPCLKFPIIPVGEFICTMMCVVGYDILEGYCNDQNECICTYRRF